MDRITDSVKTRAYTSLDLRAKVKNLTELNLVGLNTQNPTPQEISTVNQPEKGLKDITVKKPLKKGLRYHVVGAGRNNQMHASLGNLKTYEAYVDNLRKYESHTNPHLVQMSSRNDYFTKGQLSIRSPKIQEGMNNLQKFQKFQSNRLSSPKLTQKPTQH